VTPHSQNALAGYEAGASLKPRGEEFRILCLLLQASINIYQHLQFHYNPLLTFHCYINPHTLCKPPVNGYAASRDHEAFVFGTMQIDVQGRTIGATVQATHDMTVRATPSSMNVKRRSSTEKMPMKSAAFDRLPDEIIEQCVVSNPLYSTTPSLLSIQNSIAHEPKLLRISGHTE
jgi:hypothetical protein